MEYTPNIETLRDFLRVLYKHRFITITIFITVMTTIFVGQQLKTPSYEASVKMLVTGTMAADIEYRRSLGPGRITATQRELVTSKKVIERAAKALKLYERPLDYERRFATRLKAFLIDRQMEKPKQALAKMTHEEKDALLFSNAVSRLSSNIYTTQVVAEDSALFRIVARDFNPNEAVKIANVVSRSYVIFDLETQIAELQLMYGDKNITIQKLQSHIEKLKESLDGRQLSDLEALGPASVKIISQAEGAQIVSTRGAASFFIIGFILSILLGIVFSFGLEYIDHTVKNPKDIDKFFAIPFLGSIPKRKKKDVLIMSNDLEKPDLECVKAFQKVGDKISLFVKDKKIKSIMVTSLTNFADASYVTANLGIYLSRNTGKKILIIDANLTGSSISKIFNTNGNNGSNLVDVFEGKSTLKDTVKCLGDNLYFLPSRPAQFRPIKLLDSPFMAGLIKEFKNQYDLILVDCNVSLLQDVSPVIFSSYVDAVMLVLSENADEYQQVKLALDILKQKDNIIIFSVLNNRKKDLPKILRKIS